MEFILLLIFLYIFAKVCAIIFMKTDEEIINDCLEKSEPTDYVKQKKHYIKSSVEFKKEFIEEQQKYFNEQESKFNKTYHAYLRTIEWDKLKFAIYKRDNNRCRQCSKDLSKMNGNVHHVDYKNVYMEELEDLVLVCKDCHHLIHSYYKHFFPLKKTFPLLSTTQYIEAVELTNKFID